MTVFDFVEDYCTAQIAFKWLMNIINDVRTVDDTFFYEKEDIASCQVLQRFFGLKIETFDEFEEPFDPLDFDEDYYDPKERKRNVVPDNGIVF